jgi:hypothetical protein
MIVVTTNLDTLVTALYVKIDDEQAGIALYCSKTRHGGLAWGFTRSATPPCDTR